MGLPLRVNRFANIDAALVDSPHAWQVPLQLRLVPHASSMRNRPMESHFHSKTSMPRRHQIARPSLWCLSVWPFLH